MGFTTKRSNLTALMAVVGAVGAVGTGIALAAGTHQASARVTVGVKHTYLGSVLYAGPHHRTVYMYAKDHGTESACAGACARYWPPVTTAGRPKAGTGAVAGDLGTARQPGGVTQVTYKGHLLYYFSGDNSSSSAAGQGFQHLWFVLLPSGAKITKTAPSGSGNTSTGSNTTTSPGMVGTTPADVQWG